MSHFQKWFLVFRILLFCNIFLFHTDVFAGTEEQIQILESSKEQLKNKAERLANQAESSEDNLDSISQEMNRIEQEIKRVNAQITEQKEALQKASEEPPSVDPYTPSSLEHRSYTYSPSNSSDLSWIWKCIIGLALVVLLAMIIIFLNH